jgi:hypothetical protein
MKTSRSIYLITLVCLISNCVFSQTDNLTDRKTKLANIYSGLGIGVCNSGAGVSVDGTFILSNNWGASIRYNPNYLSAKNLPNDYVDLVLFVPFLTNGLPTDDIVVLTINAVKEFPTGLKLIRFGIEFGPSLVFAKVEEFTPVENPLFPFFGSNYEVTHDKRNTVGFSLRGKIEFPLTRFAGLQVLLHTNLNSIRSVFGGEFGVTLGLVRER